MNALRLGLAANLCAAGLIVLAALKADDAVLEGAYFNRSVGESAAAFATSGTDVTPYLVTAAVLLVVGTLMLVRAPGVRSSSG